MKKNKGWRNSPCREWLYKLMRDSLGELLQEIRKQNEKVNNSICGQK